MSKVQEALKLIDESGYTAYGAALHLGISSASVYSAIQRRKLKQLQGIVKCPTCGSEVPKENIKNKSW